MQQRHTKLPAVPKVLENISAFHFLTMTKDGRAALNKLFIINPSLLKGVTTNCLSTYPSSSRLTHPNTALTYLRQDETGQSILKKLVDENDEIKQFLTSSDTATSIYSAK